MTRSGCEVVQTISGRCGVCGEAVDGGHVTLDAWSVEKGTWLHHEGCCMWRKSHSEGEVKDLKGEQVSLWGEGL